MAQLKDLCDLIVDCEHKTAPTQETGYPSIRTPNIGRGRLILDGVNRVSEETYDAWTQREVPKPGDLILAREAPIGNVAIIPPALKLCLGQRTVLIRSDRSFLNPQYLTYLMLGDEIQGKILSMSNGATVHHLNMKDIRELEMPPMPGLAVQDRIATILSAYDDLIENNNRRIKILEEMAQMLYREWFVNFRFPGHQKVKMVESELGPMPEGWESKSIGDVVQVMGGGTPSTSVPEYWENGDVIWYSPSDLTAAGTMFVSRSCKTISRLGLEKSSARLFPPNSVMMTSRATIGVVAINRTEACTNQGFITCIPGKTVKTYQIYFWLLENRPKIIGLATGATFKEINKATFRQLPIVAAPDKITDGFEATVGPIGELIANLIQKNANLRTTRDFLLPKLVSGEIPVAAAAELVEQTA
jgi:type I restriction enzyme S subunit